MPIYLTTPYPMLYICSVMTRKGGRRGGLRGRSMMRPNKKGQIVDGGGI